MPATGSERLSRRSASGRFITARWRAPLSSASRPFVFFSSSVSRVIMGSSYLKHCPRISDAHLRLYSYFCTGSESPPRHGVVRSLERYCPILAGGARPAVTGVAGRCDRWDLLKRRKKLDVQVGERARSPPSSPVNGIQSPILLRSARSTAAFRISSPLADIAGDSARRYNCN